MIIKGIVVIPTQGFANRIKMIASTNIFCELKKIKLFICWNKSEECNIELEDIFTRKNNFSTITLDEIQNNKYCYFGRVHTCSLFDKIDKVIEDKENQFEYLLIEGGHEFKHTSMERIQFIYHKRNFYRSLVSSNKIMTKVNKFLDINKNIFNNNSKIVGVHYREIDSKYDSMDINNNDIVNFTLNSPFKAFEKIIQKFKKDDTYFIVMSNNNTIKDKFRELFPNLNIVSSETSLFDRCNPDAMIDSIVDFIILTKCDILIGSYFSSFSDEASIFNLIPKITPLSDSRIENITSTVQNYHCINYSYIDNIAALNFNDKIFLDYLIF